MGTLYRTSNIRNTSANNYRLESYKDTESKIVELDKENLSLMPLDDTDIKYLIGVNASNDLQSIPFKVGEIYSLTSEDIEGVSVDNTIYFRLYGIIGEYKGVELNSLILKEGYFNDNGEFIEEHNYAIKRRMFSIPPLMCKEFGVKYQPGYELWPITQQLKPVNAENKVISTKNKLVYENLSTYPTSEIDGTIRKLLLELHGFSCYGNDSIITPTGNVLKTETFLASLTMQVNSNIPTDNGCAGYLIGDKIPFKVIINYKDGKPSAICDDKHNIYVEVDLTKTSNNITTSDGMVGVAVTALRDKDIDDFITVKWEEETEVTKTRLARKERKPRYFDDDSYQRVINLQHSMDELEKTVDSLIGKWMF